MLVTDVLNKVDAELECDADENAKTGPDVEETEEELVKTGFVCDRALA